MEGSVAYMSRMRQTSNPVFRTLEKNDTYVGERAASYSGISLKMGIMFGLMLLGGALAASLLRNGEIERLMGIIGVASIAGFIAVLISIFSVRFAAPFSMLYAFAQGITVGTLTLIVEGYLPGTGTIAMVATAIIFGVMLLLYSIKAIRVTPKFRIMMFGIIITILIFSIMSIFIQPLNDLFYGNSVASIVISVFLIIYGAFMLTLDFDRAKTMVEYGADKRTEWQIAVGLLVTIIWIYVEILRLLVMIASRRD